MTVLPSDAREFLISMLNTSNISGIPNGCAAKGSGGGGVCYTAVRILVPVGYCDTGMVMLGHDFLDYRGQCPLSA